MILWKFGGAVCLDDDVLDALAQGHDGDAWVLTHGAGPQLDAALRALEGEPERVAGLRVTSPAGADLVLETLDRVGAEMASKLQDRGVPAVHIPAGWLSAVPKVHPEGDLGRVGTPLAVDATEVQKAIADGKVPVVTPVGFDEDGPLNVNADEAAQALATALKVEGMHLVTDVPQVRGPDGGLPELDTEAALGLIASGDAKGGMVPKLQNAIATLDAGVPRVDIGTIQTLIAGQGTSIVPTVRVFA